MIAAEGGDCGFRGAGWQFKEDNKLTKVQKDSSAEVIVPKFVRYGSN